MKEYALIRLRDTYIDLKKTRAVLSITRTDPYADINPDSPRAPPPAQQGRLSKNPGHSDTHEPTELPAASAFGLLEQDEEGE